jgi:DNA-binding XRE family transcriptional regulator
MNKIIFFRSEIGMSQEALGAVTGLGRWVIRAIELGFRSASEDEKKIIAQFLGQSILSVFPTQKVVSRD